MGEITPSKHPNFSKLLFRSSVKDRFYLRIPGEFSKNHLPLDDHDVVLMGENEKEYSARYDAKQRRLMSGGWKNFSVENNLLEGDTVDFHMIEPLKFKVHIARASRSTDSDFVNKELGDTVQKDDLIEENTCVGHTTTHESPVSHTDSGHQIQKDRMVCQNGKRMRLEVPPSPTEEMMPVTAARACRSTKLGGADGNSNSNIHDSPCDAGMSVLLTAVRACRSTELGGADGNSNSNIHDSPRDAEHTGIAENETRPILNSESMPLEDQRDECCADSLVSLGRKSTDCLNFEDVNGFDNFKIYVNGEALDADIPDQSRMKYYELCCSQNKFLHSDLGDNLSRTLVATMILEITRIAEATKADSILFSTVPHLEGMDLTLKSFEVLGMTVGFLRARICEFAKLLNEYQTVAESKNIGLIEIERERTALHAEKAKIDELMQSATAREALIGSLESKVDSLKEESQRMFDKMLSKATSSAW